MLDFEINKLSWDDKGLIPVVVQDIDTKTVLMLAYMNEKSLKKTLETKETWFFSRSRQELWHKGATSGNTQQVKAIKMDCDGDTLLVLVEQQGVACHTGNYSCFQEEKSNSVDYQVLDDIIATINRRDIQRPEGSYTTYLLEKGLDKILKKVGEEASEVIIAAKNQDKEELVYEASDLLFHLLVLLHVKEVPIADVLVELQKRADKK